jgi:hypothetical protein
VCVCVYACMYVLCIYVHIYVCMYIMYVRTYALCTYVLRLCMYVCTYIRTYVRMYVCMYVMYVCIVCMCQHVRVSACTRACVLARARVYESRAAQIFYISGSQFKILDVTGVTWSSLHAEAPERVGATVKESVARATGCPWVYVTLYACTCRRAAPTTTMLRLLVPNALNRPTLEQHLHVLL